MTSTNVDPDASAREEAPPPSDAAPQSTELLYTAGQSAWLALMSVVSVAALAIAVVALVVANSGDGGGGGGVASDGAPSGPVTEATIGAGEFSFTPPDVALVADEEATVELQNDGAVEHNWTVIDQGTTVETEDEIPDAPTIGGVDTLAAGESGSTTLTLEAGTYQVICTIAGHLAAGMEGTVTATGAA